VQFRCLVVDDNKRFLEVAKRSLEFQGLAGVSTAATIQGALAAIAAEQPDVVLVDVSLGTESGFDLVRQVADRFPRLVGRMILISTRAEEDYAELLEDTPTVGFLAKSAMSVRAISAMIPDLT